jgi:hypothetical protein
MESSKIVQYGDLRISIGRFTPRTGSFILMRLLGAASIGAAKIASSLGLTGQVETTIKDAAQVDPESEARRLVSAALMTNENQSLHETVWSECLKVCSEMKADHQDMREVAIPLMTGGGEVAHPGLRSDMALQMRLVNDCLVFNFSDFFAQGGLKQLTEPQSTTMKV